MLIPDSLIITIVGGVVVAYFAHKLAKSRSREQEIYVPVFNRVNKNINTLDYNSEEGQFRNVYESFDARIQNGIDKETKGHLLVLKGKIDQLTRSLSEYHCLVKQQSDSTDFITKRNNSYYIAIDNEGYEILLDEFLSKFAVTILYTSKKGDLWKRLNQKAENKDVKSRINHWDFNDERINYLWSVKEDVYQNNPTMSQSFEEVYEKAIDRARIANDSVKSKIS